MSAITKLRVVDEADRHLGTDSISRPGMHGRFHLSLRGEKDTLLAPVLLAIALLAPGCTTGPGQWIRNGFRVGPNYCQPPAAVSDGWIDSEQDNIVPQPADDSYWWSVFDDPTLNRLVFAAYEQNLPLKVAGMRVLEARAQLGVAKGGLFPQEQRATGYYTRSQFSRNSYPLASSGFRSWLTTPGLSVSMPPGNSTSRIVQP
jgi:hypothetical protein